MPVLMFQRRPTPPTLSRPKTFDCPRCDVTDPDPEVLFRHLMSRHQDQRRMQTPLHPMRRTGDRPATSPATRRFIQAAEAGEGLHRGSPRRTVS